jgi:hypothetical protein
LISGWPNWAVCAATTKSQKVASSIPPPRQWPWTAAMGDALDAGQATKDGVKRREYFADAVRDVIRNLRARRKTLWAVSLENEEIGVWQRLIEGGVQLPHHFDVENIERRTVQRDPCRASLDASVNCTWRHGSPAIVRIS